MKQFYGSRVPPREDTKKKLKKIEILEAGAPYNEKSDFSYT